MFFDAFPALIAACCCMCLAVLFADSAARCSAVFSTSDRRRLRESPPICPGNDTFDVVRIKKMQRSKKRNGHPFTHYASWQSSLLVLGRYLALPQVYLERGKTERKNKEKGNTLLTDNKIQREKVF